MKKTAVLIVLTLILLVVGILLAEETKANPDCEYPVRCPTPYPGPTLYPDPYPDPTSDWGKYLPLVLNDD